MKSLLSLALLATGLSWSSVNAAQLSIDPPAGSPNGVYSLFLDGQTTTFNALGISVKPDNGAQFLNVSNSSVPRPPGQAFTYRNRLLDADPADYPGGKSWTVLGPITTPGEIAYVAGPIGQTISTASEPGGRLFLANFMLPAGATATALLTLVNGVDTVFQQTLVFPIPEPTSTSLASLAAIGAVAARRRRHA